MPSKNWKAQSPINKGDGDMVKALNTPPLKNLLGAAVKALRSHKVCDGNYKNLIVQLAPRWRVIACKDGIQWILQRKQASHAGPWRRMSYHINRDGLLRACGSVGALNNDPLEALEALPDYASQLANK
jgi:hypothetical protein